MPTPDPIEALAVGISADHKATKGRGKKGDAKAQADAAGEQAKADATEAGSTGEEAEALATVVGEAVEEAVDQSDEEAPAVPPAPGDDAASVFDRRLDRLNRLVEEAEFDSGTAFGDLRDCVLDLFKHRPKLWSAMTPSEHKDVIRAVEASAKAILEKIVLVIAEEDDVSIHATLLPAFNVKGDAIEAKIKIDHVNDDGVLDVYRLAGHKVVVIDAAATRFMSARRTIDPGEDQTTMQFADPAPKPASAQLPDHPADDSDLNPDDGEDDADTNQAEAQVEGDAWGVFDTDRGEWLIDENGGDDGWTSNARDAGKWAHDRAKELATDFADGGEGVVARQLDADPTPERMHDSDSVVDD